MKTKILGRTGLEVSIVGLGAGRIGLPDPERAGASYTGNPEEIDVDLGVETVHTAVQAGCTLIDTAPLYSGTHSERIIGRALKARPDLAAGSTVTTKVGRLREGHDYTFDAILRHVEESQERLGIEQFQILYIHDAMDAPMDLVMGKNGALGALRKLQSENVVRFVGTAANDPETNASYIETGEFDAAVVPEAWSLLNQLAEKRILPAAEKHNVGLVIATPVERGLLAFGPKSGAVYDARTFSRACLDHAAKIQTLCKDHNIPMVAAALQFCTRHPQVTATIPGARTPDEATENARAGDLEIPVSFWDDLEPLVRHWEKGVDR